MRTRLVPPSLTSHRPFAPCRSGALLIPLVLDAESLRKRASLARWRLLKGGRLETYEQLGRRVPDPLTLSEDGAFEKLRAELDHAASLSHKLSESYGSPAVGRVTPGAGGRSRTRVGGSGKTLQQSMSDSSLVRVPVVTASGRGGLHGQGSLPALPGMEGRGARVASKRATLLDWHARQAVAHGGNAKWH